VKAGVRCPVRPLQERLSELGVGKGWKLKFTLPKPPRNELNMDASETNRQPRPPSPQYQCPEEGLYLDPSPHLGTYDPPPPYLGSIPTKPGKGRRPEKS
jgi:hypothetical protein